MSEQNVIVVVGGKETVFRACANRIEVNRILSRLEALTQLQKSYLAVRNEIIGYTPPPEPIQEDGTEEGKVKRAEELRKRVEAEAKVDTAALVAKLPPAKRLDAFEQLADLDLSYKDRSLKLINELFADLSVRAIRGRSPEEFDMGDTLEAATRYATQQMLSEDERKNSNGGSDTSEPGHEAPSPETAVGSSLTAKPAKS